MEEGGFLYAETYYIVQKLGFDDMNTNIHKLRVSILSINC